jgi:hypothetical protein
MFASSTDQVKEGNRNGPPDANRLVDGGYRFDLETMKNPSPSGCG